MKLGQVPDHFRRVFRVEIAGRLVGENQLGPVQQRTGHGQALPLPGAEFAGAMAGAIGQAEFVHQPAGPLPHLSAWFAGTGQQHVSEQIEIRDEMKHLKHEPDLARAKPRPLRRRQCVKVTPGELH